MFSLVKLWTGLNKFEGKTFKFYEKVRDISLKPLDSRSESRTTLDSCYFKLIRFGFTLMICLPETDPIIILGSRRIERPLTLTRFLFFSGTAYVGKIKIVNNALTFI